jgi:protein CpxP
MFRTFRSLAAIVGATLLAAGLGTAALAHAGGHPRGFGRGAGGDTFRGLARLDLTDAQRNQIRDVRQRHQAELRAAAERLRKAHETQREAIDVIPVDEARIRTASAAVAEAQADMAVLRARIHGEVWSVLTPEQQSKAKELRAQRAERMKQRLQRMQERWDRRG